MPEPKGVAMVTGAGSGIGRASALALARDGFALVLAGRRRAPLEESAALAAEFGGEPLMLECDVTRAEDVAALFAATRERFGRLDFLFNNAGRMTPPMPIEEMSVEEWRLTTETNLTGVFLCTQGAFRLMKRQTPRGGRIINNGSIAAHAPRPGFAPYTASKHGVTGLTRQAALEGRDHDICVGQIDIGNARTTMVAGPGEASMSIDNVAESIRYLANLPLEANVLFMTVHARTMPFVGRG